MFKPATALILLLLLLSCSPERKAPQNGSTPPPKPQGDTLLSGRWEWLIARGGPNGRDSVTLRDREPNSIIFSSDGSFRSFIGQRQVESGTYSLLRGGDSLRSVHFKSVDSLSGEDFEQEMLASLRNDTLSLYPAGCSDCLSDYYKKSSR